MAKKRQQTQRTTNPVGLFILYLRERGYDQKSSHHFVHPVTGDKVTVEYIRGKAAMYECSSGHDHVIWYDECPLPKKTLDWWHKNHSPKPKRNHRPRRRSSKGTMAMAFKEAKR